MAITNIGREMSWSRNVLKNSDHKFCSKFYFSVKSPSYPIEADDDDFRPSFFNLVFRLCSNIFDWLNQILSIFLFFFFYFKLSLSIFCPILKICIRKNMHSAKNRKTYFYPDFFEAYCMYLFYYFLHLNIFVKNCS